MVRKFQITSFLLACTIFYFGKLYGQIDSFYHLNHIPKLEITFDDENWVNKLHAKRKLDNRREDAQLLVDGWPFQEVGIRFKGNSSYHRVARKEEAKLPWNIKLNEKNDDQALPTGHQKIKLANVFGDPTFLREVLAYELAGNYMPAPKANFAQVFVNKEYLGLYTNTEAVDKLFIEHYFDESSGTFIKCDPESWKISTPSGCKKSEYASLDYLGENEDCYQPYYKFESKDDWKKLINFTKALQKGEKLEELLDIDKCLWMHAFNNIIANLDSYAGLLCHNYYLYQDASGRFAPIIWDLNLAFGGFRLDGEKSGMLTNEELISLSPFLHINNSKRPLIYQLLKNPSYRKQYLAHYRTIFQNHFQNDALKKRAIALQKFIREEVKMDPNKLCNTQLFEANFNATVSPEGQEIIGLLEFLEGRTAYLEKHPLMQMDGVPILSDVQSEISNSMMTITCKAVNAETIECRFRTIPDAPFSNLKMKMVSSDTLQSTNQFSVSIPYLKGTEYYFLAENERAAAFLPDEAAFKYFIMQ